MITSWNSKQPIWNGCLVISHHFRCIELVHHPIDFQPLRPSCSRMWYAANPPEVRAFFLGRIPHSYYYVFTNRTGKVMKMLLDASLRCNQSAGAVKKSQMVVREPSNGSTGEHTSTSGLRGRNNWMDDVAAPRWAVTQKPGVILLYIGDETLPNYINIYQHKD